MRFGQRDNLFERFASGFPIEDFDHLVAVEQEINFDSPLSAPLHMEMGRLMIVRPEPDLQSRYLKRGNPRHFYLTPLSDIGPVLSMKLSAWPRKPCSSRDHFVIVPPEYEPLLSRRAIPPCLRRCRVGRAIRAG